MKREYCCPMCGLIWFAESTDKIICPECENSNEKMGVYACDTFGYCYASESIKEHLEKRQRKIHYSKEHPYYEGVKI